jgi:hypothetical protein
MDGWRLMSKSFPDCPRLYSQCNPKECFYQPFENPGAVLVLQCCPKLEGRAVPVAFSQVTPGKGLTDEPDFSTLRNWENMSFLSEIRVAHHNIHHKSRALKGKGRCPKE